jgi:hypothetical protein
MLRGYLTVHKIPECVPAVVKSKEGSFLGTKLLLGKIKCWFLAKYSVNAFLSSLVALGFPAGVGEQ